MNHRNCLLAFIPVLIVITAGCSRTPEGPRTVPAKGVITLDGEPVEGAAIVFVGDPHSANAMSEADGSFSLDAFPYKTGAVPGTYMWLASKTVEITTESVEMKGEEAEHAAEGGEAQQVGVKNDLPQYYSTPHPDDTFTIPEDGITDLKIELTSKR